MQKLNCSDFNLGDKMCFIPNSYNHYNTSFSKFWLVLQILWTTLLFQDHNSRYSKDLIANMSFLEVIDENEPQVELEKLSKVAPTIGIGKAIEVINYAMKKVNHALYRGKVFWKADKCKLFYNSHKFNTYWNWTFYFRS